MSEKVGMDKMMGFEYKHNNKVVFQTEIGTIELTYKTREGQRKDEEVLEALFAGIDGLGYEEPARNEPTFFQAVLLDANNKIRYMVYEVLADKAIKELYKLEAVSRMEAEFYPKPWNY